MAPRLPTSSCPQRLLRALFAVAVLCCGARVVAAQSSTAGGPVLLTEADSTRAVALESTSFLSGPFALTTPSLIGADRRTRLVLFAANVELYAGEGAGAFTAEAEDARRRAFPLRVEAVAPVPGFEGLTQIVVRLHDEMQEAGDVLVRVALRGMTSNRVRVALGHTGGGPPDDAGAAPNPAPQEPPAPRPLLTPDPYTGPATSADTVRLLEQATFGPTEAEVARVRALGFRAYLDEQFNAPPSGYPSLTQMPVDSNLGCQGANTHDCIRDNYTMYPLQTRFFRNAIYGPDQLRQRVAFALHQILVVSGRDLGQPSRVAPYLQTLDRHAFGNFRTLLREMTLNAAMGEFLNTAGNGKDKPNENYAREFLQLFTVGPDLLNPDGSPRLDSQGRRTPTYDQDTITNFARVFTGWVFAPPPPGTQCVVNYQDPLVANERNHDTGAKTLLDGAQVPAGQTAAQDLDAAVSNAFHHPNAGPFIAKRLIRHLVTSNPSRAYVERAARVFDNNCVGFYPEAGCAGERGDLRSVVRAILLDPEARGDVKTDPDYGRLREPVLYITSVCRAFNAFGLGPGIVNIVQSDGQLNPVSIEMGQDLLQPPNVFGYFPAEYAVPGTALRGPEFGTLSTSTSLRRMAFASQMTTRSGITSSFWPDVTSGTHINFTSFQPLASDPARLTSALDALLLHNTMSAEMRAAVTQAMLAVPTSDPNHLRNRTQSAIYLVLSSPQYQVQR